MKKIVYDFVCHMDNGNHIGETKPLCKRKAKKYFKKLIKIGRMEGLVLLSLAPEISQDIKWVRYFGNDLKSIHSWFDGFGEVGR